MNFPELPRKYFVFPGIKGVQIFCRVLSNLRKDHYCLSISTWRLIKVLQYRLSQPALYRYRVLIEAYLAVPVRYFASLYLISLPSEDINFLASPKSMMKTRWEFLPLPIGNYLVWCLCEWFFLAWIYSILLIICWATIKTVFRDKFLLQLVKRSSRDLPRRSITIKLLFS